MFTRPLILIIDSDPQTYTLLGDALTQAGYHSLCCDTGREALMLLESRKPALIILELILSDQSGWDIFRELRSRLNVPMLILTSLSDEAQELAALDGGADDYVVKPFSVLPVIARVEALLRRMGYSRRRIVRGAITIEPTENRVVVDGQPVTLTEREFALLKVLAAAPGRAFSRGELLARCWEQNFSGTNRVVDVHLASLRRKLGPKRDLIFTVRGIGYKLSSS